ncbi:MAG: S-layer homology domain-containing protein [Anaerotignum sp.]|nr:S-layer homology domain-containing protein [Anaerotignum sp.]
MLINTTKDNQGLFSYIQDGTVENLMLTDYVVIGRNNCGGIVSSISDGSIQNCGVTGAMVGDTSGGIAAELSHSSMESCYTMATMKGANCGSVAAQAENSSWIQSTYYIAVDVNSGIPFRDGSVTDTTMGKDTESFANGEVAWLLDTYGGGADYTHQEIWSRDAKTPVFADSTHQTVYRVLLQNSENPTAVYSSANGSITLPSTPSDVDGYTLLGWFTDASFSNAYTAPSALFQDEIIYGSFGTRIISAEDYFTRSTGNAVDYNGAISDNASEIIGASPLTYTYYIDSAGTIPTTRANSGASGEGLAPVRVGMYYVKISAPETDSNGVKLKAASTLVGMKIKSKDTTDYYSVTATQSTGGTISVSSSTVEEGCNATITITPKEGYEISDVLVNGISVGAVSSYTIKAMNSDITISAVYQAVDSEIDNKTGDEIDTPSDEPAPNEPWSNPFQDVPEGSWYHSAVEFVCTNNLFHGTSENAFSPKSPMTRAMLVSVLGRLSGNTAGYSNAFSDVAEGSWYEQSAAWAAANGIVSGTGSDCFSPENNITREQLAVILYNYAKYKGYDVSIEENANTLPFGDASYISNYAYQALQWAYAAGIIHGDEMGNLNPQGFATRAEGATILERFVETIIS